MKRQPSGTSTPDAGDGAPARTDDLDRTEPLTRFEPGVRDWFESRFRIPTDIQERSWPVIAEGAHVLICAPTGSGKTLTAFLWALNRFAAGESAPGATRILYVSPLKALNNDIQRNLLGPLGELRELGRLPPLRVETRSGDSTPGDRQRMLRRPPEILVTTPESLNLLLTTSRGRHALATVETVILDEIHALVDNRRGTLLLTALERLTLLSGEFQRIALSATVEPAREVATFIGGRDAQQRPRPVRVIAGARGKQLELTVRFPEAARSAADRGEKIWEPLAATFREHIARNQATLFFANSRRLAETVTLRINEAQPAVLAWAHHGSLSRDLREQVEQRLKSGELRAIVATSSLELGIDIGTLDEVVLIQSPPAIAAALQRIGRAGHQVGAVSRGVLYPTHAQDLVKAAALATAIAAEDIEPVALLRNPLDVLAQIIVSMTASEPWRLDALYRLLCQSSSYQSLPRDQFDGVVEMLAGRSSGSQIRELKPRLAVDRIQGTARAEPRAVLALYTAGGVIPDRGYYQLRHADNGARLGELDEEFVWEASVGQVFTLGSQRWQIHRITHNDVLVKPTRRASGAPPFWRSETQNRSVHFSTRIAEFLEQADALLNGGSRDGAAPSGGLALQQRLQERHAFDDSAAAALTGHLQRQRAHTGTALPHGHHLLLERIHTGPGGYRGTHPIQQLVIHSVAGGRVNRPWALALKTVLIRRGLAPEIHADDDAIAIQTSRPVDARELLALVTADNVDALLRESLESSGTFGGRFREAAGRSLLLSRQRFNTRLPLWMSRLQSKRLLQEVQGYDNFPMLIETWRACLEDEFDLPALKHTLAALDTGAIHVSAVDCDSPSPFAAHLAFGQINRYMYADDRSEGALRSALPDDLIRAALSNPELRPRLRGATVAAFLAKRQRTAPGYEPETGADWLAWVRERVLIPETEVTRDETHPYLVWVEAGLRRWLAHRESLAALQRSELGAALRFAGPVPDIDDPRDGRQLALDLLSYYGPLTRAAIETLLPALPVALLDDEQLVSGALLEDDPQIHYCDAGNYEALLRLQRALNRPSLDPLPAHRLPAFLARWQGFGTHPDPGSALAPLRGFRAPVSVWLNDLVAARCPELAPAQLDAAFTELGLAWQGDGPEQLRIGYPEDLALAAGAPAPADVPDPASPPVETDAPAKAGGADTVTPLFTDPAAGYSFLQLAERQPHALAEFNRHWWTAVWQGAISADSLAALRQGALRQFRIEARTDGRTATRPALRPGRRAAPRFQRSGYANPWPGTWRLSGSLLPETTTPETNAAETDLLVATERARERARMLLDRYGIVCRELANREGDALRWQVLFPALRLMELAGEVLAGYFVEGLSGPQFATADAVAELQRADPPAPAFWISALDPAAPTGLGLDWPELPQRRAGNYLGFHAGELALSIENRGKRLRFRVPPDHPGLADACAPLRHLLALQRRVDLDEINGAPAAGSPYLETFAGFARIVADHRRVCLEAE